MMLRYLYMRSVQFVDEQGEMAFAFTVWVHASSLRNRQIEDDSPTHRRAQSNFSLVVSSMPRRHSAINSITRSRDVNKTDLGIISLRVCEARSDVRVKGCDDA